MGEEGDGCASEMIQEAKDNKTIKLLYQTFQKFSRSGMSPAKSSDTNSNSEGKMNNTSISQSNLGGILNEMGSWNKTVFDAKMLEKQLQLVKIENNKLQSKLKQATNDCQVYKKQSLRTESLMAELQCCKNANRQLQDDISRRKVKCILFPILARTVFVVCVSCILFIIITIGKRQTK